MTHVLICGMPRSGNRILNSLCRTAGIPGTVWHGAVSAPSKMAEITWERHLPDLKALIPVRDPKIQRRSWKNYKNLDGVEELHRKIVFRELAAREIETRIIPYRSIVDHPLQTGNDIREWFGLQPLGTVAAIWGQGIYDGDAKYLE